MAVNYIWTIYELYDCEPYWKGHYKKKEHNQHSVERGNNGNTYTRFKHFFKLLKTYGMYEDARQNVFATKYMNW